MHRGAGRGNKLRGRPRRRGEYQGQRRAESHKEPRGSWRKRERGGALDLPKKSKYNAEFGAATAVKDGIPALTGRRGAQRSAEMVEVEVQRNGIALRGNHVNGGGAGGKIFDGEIELESGAGKGAAAVLRKVEIGLAGRREGFELLVRSEEHTSELQSQ